MRYLKKYFWNILIAVDQLFNALFLGDPDETISSRLGKHVESRDCVFAKWICSLLNILDEKHCQKAIERDEDKDSVFYE